jgi:hypothetical protein
MRKTGILLVLVSAAISSCGKWNSSGHYQNYPNNIRLDLTQGKWLLNEIDAPNQARNDLKELAFEKLERFLGNRLVYVYDAKIPGLPARIPMNPTKAVLKNLKEVSGYDFFINIKAANIPQETATKILVPGNFSDRIARSTVVIEIYDLNKQQIIFGRKSTNSKRFEYNPDQQRYVRTSGKLMVYSLECLMKSIRKTAQY